jgi:N-acetylneuraminic acid mutarotase
MKGSNSGNGSAVYGLAGEAATMLTPGGRQQSAGWVDSANQLWLFGGGTPLGMTQSYFNDLWKYDGTNWIFVGGGSTANQPGKYGSDGNYAPGGRASAVSWTDSDSKLWLFGGNGYDNAGDVGYLNDLWKYDPSTAIWTWISGSNVSDQTGDYGTKGTESASNVPRSRYGSVTWLEPRPSTSSSNLWLFGGYSRDNSASPNVLLNDLWKFDSKTQNWTWVSGTQLPNQKGVYGTLGTGSSSNMPGARSGAVSWYDSYGNLWLFGGYGYDESGATGNLNDLWKFYGGSWTWVSGSKTANSNGTYGQKGTSAIGNIPGARSGAIAWMDRPPASSLWLFGGSGFDYNGVYGVLNDLWRYDGTNWTWISGSYTVSQSGTYGQFATPGAANVPGSRSSALSWIDGSNILWLFGGYGFDQAGSMVLLNDLWKGRP